MNKNVFEYLNGKAQQVTDYIRTKAEAAGNYLSEHAQDIKQGAIKTTAAVLTAATLLGGMTGCNKEPEYQDVIVFPIVSIKEPEEIQEVGITAEDVLAVYDNYCLKRTQADLARHKDEYGEHWDFLSAQFNKLTVNQRNLPVSSNIRDGWNITNEPFFHTIGQQDGCYETTIYYDAAMRDEIEAQRNTAQLFTVTEFENLLTAFNVNCFELTDEYWAKNPLYAGEYNYITGVNVYEPFEITRETILNANEEQLWALYYAGIEATKLIEPISSNLQ